MKIGQAFPSRYIKADDIPRPTQVQIAGVHIENVGTDQKPENKPVLYFLFQGRPAEKGMVLNRTNADTISMDLGDETDAWIGHTVELFKQRVQGPNGMVDGIRLRMIFPNQPAAPAPVPATTFAPHPQHVPLAAGNNLPPSSAFRQPAQAAQGPFGPEPPIATPNSYGAKPALDDDIPF